MAQSVKPIAKRIYVCNEVVRDPTTGKVSLFNLWDAIRLPPQKVFPYSLAKLCVFVWWRGGWGKVKSHIDIVQASTGLLIRRTKEYSLGFEDRKSSIFACYQLRDCSFPEPGYYFIELYCAGEFVDDQVIQAIPA